MAEKKQNKTPKRRTEVKDMPRPERELTPDERKQVKGGAKQIIYSSDATPDPNAST